MLVECCETQPITNNPRKLSKGTCRGGSYFHLNYTNHYLLPLVKPSDSAFDIILANIWVVLAQHDGMEYCALTLTMWECCEAHSIPPRKYPESLANNGCPCFYLNSPFFHHKWTLQILMGGHGMLMANFWEVLAHFDGTEGVVLPWEWECCDTESKPSASLQKAWVMIDGPAST